MSKILSPNPLVITVTLNEITGEIKAHTNRPVPHIEIVAVLLQAAQGFLADGMRQAAAQNQRVNPATNPPANPGGDNGPQT